MFTVHEAKNIFPIQIANFFGCHEPFFRMLEDLIAFIILNVFAVIAFQIFQPIVVCTDSVSYDLVF